MSQSPTAIAFFDLDGTITHTDTFLAFIRYTNGRFNFFLGLLILSPFIVAFYLGCYSNHHLKRRFFSYFYKGKSVTDIQQQGNEFSKTILPTLCRKGALKLLQQHKASQHQIYIVTASADIWVSAWCQQNGYLLISTQFAHQNGQYTGDFNGLNCYGKVKKPLVQSIIDQHPLATTFSYGDSPSDQHFLSLASYSHCMPLNMRNIRKHQLLTLSQG